MHATKRFAELLTQHCVKIVRAAQADYQAIEWAFQNGLEPPNYRETDVGKLEADLRSTDRRGEFFKAHDAAVAELGPSGLPAFSHLFLRAKDAYGKLWEHVRQAFIANDRMDYSNPAAQQPCKVAGEIEEFSRPLCAADSHADAVAASNEKGLAGLQELPGKLEEQTAYERQLQAEAIATALVPMLKAVGPKADALTTIEAFCAMVPGGFKAKTVHNWLSEDRRVGKQVPTLVSTNPHNYLFSELREYFVERKPDFDDILPQSAVAVLVVSTE
jgi:hypothetical protein